MSYFKDKDTISLFCIANFSKLTIWERFIKWWSRFRFDVATFCLECLQFSGITSLDLKVKSSVEIRFSIFQLLKSPFNVSLTIHSLLLS